MIRLPIDTGCPPDWCSRFGSELKVDRDMNDPLMPLMVRRVKVYLTACARFDRFFIDLA